MIVDEGRCMVNHLRDITSISVMYFDGTDALQQGYHRVMRSRAHTRSGFTAIVVSNVTQTVTFHKRYKGDAFLGMH